ncbi:MAG: hypothetical protein U1A22_14380 [Xanthomonadaceae bacterium]|nr:hypothetical protein [Xanthomonadaceae bacterium]
MNDSDPLKCTFEDARRETLLQGITLSTRAKIALFEEMVTLAMTFGAYDRLVARRTAATRRSESRPCAAASPNEPPQC